MLSAYWRFPSPQPLYNVKRHTFSRIGGYDGEMVRDLLGVTNIQNCSNSSPKQIQNIKSEASSDRGIFMSKMNEEDDMAVLLIYKSSKAAKARGRWMND